MAKANSVQTSFLGGEWSPYAQGRLEHPDYRRGMNVCSNGIPLTEGAWTRRPGFLREGATYGGHNGIIRPFLLENNVPAYLEITYNAGASSLQVWVPTTDGLDFKRLTDQTRTVSAISGATPAVVQVSATESWSTGTPVVFGLDPATAIGPSSTLITSHREFSITVADTTHFSIADGVTGTAVNGTDLAYVHSAADTVSRVFTLTLPYTTLAQVQALRIVQADNLAVLLAPGVEPYALYWNGSVFTLAAAGYSTWHGPYLDPHVGASQQGTSTAEVDAWDTTPVLHVTDGGFEFVAGDVGRPVALFAQPPPWSVTFDYTTITAVQVYVTYNGTYWHLSAGNSFHMPIGTAPGTSYTYTDSGKVITFVPWTPFPLGGFWMFGAITSFVDTSHVGVTLEENLVNTTNTNYGLVVDDYRIGAFGNGRFPTSGAYYEGRLTLLAAWPNRFDLSVANALDLELVSDANGVVPRGAFEPFDRYGNVGDGNAVSAIANDAELNTLLWANPDTAGILMGSPGGEFLVTASALNDPLTSSSIQAHKITKFKAANIEPRQVGSALMFVQALQRRVLEFFTESLTGKYTARHLNEFAGHLSIPGIAELWYQEERVPVLWCRLSNGALIGCTYRRFSNYGESKPEFAAWFQAPHGRAHEIISLCVGPSPDTKIDCLMAITKSPENVYAVERLTEIFEEDQVIDQASYLDGAIVANGKEISGTIKFYGLSDYATKTVSVWLAGLDCGDHVVASDGTFSVAFGADPDGLFSANFLFSKTASTWQFAAQIDTTGHGRVVVPCLIGAVMTSRGQVLRPIQQESAHTPTGHALGMTARGNWYAALLANTAAASNGDGIKFGTDFDHLRPVLFRTPGGTAYPENTMFNGVHFDALDDDYNFDSMVCWEIDRPYPATVAAISTFIDTNERE